MQQTTQPYDVSQNDAPLRSRWGYVDTKFILNKNDAIEVTGSRYLISGYEMPYFIPFVEEVLQLPFNKEARTEAQPNIPKAKINKLFVGEVNKKLKHRLTLDDETRFRHSHGSRNG